LVDLLRLFRGYSGLQKSALKMGWFVTNTYGDMAVIKEYRTPTWFYSHVTLFCRVLGPLVMVAMWALTVTAFTLVHPFSGIWLLFLAILLIFQEFAWLFGRMSFLKHDNCIGTCWRGFVWFEDWKRALEYLIMAIISFIIGGFSSWPLFLGGALILLLGVFYLLKAIRFTKIELLSQPVAGSGLTGPATAPPVWGSPNQEWGTPGSKY